MPISRRLAPGLALALLTTAAAAEVKPLPPGDAAPMMAIDTATFLAVATGSNQFEIDAGTLALEKGGAAVKPLAEMIVADHTKAGETLKATMEGKGQPFAPAAPAPKQRKMLEQLRAADGAAFDTLYLHIQAQAHMEAIALFRTYAGTGDDAAVVGFAKATLPRLEAHMGHVTKLVAAE